MGVTENAREENAATTCLERDLVANMMMRGEGVGRGRWWVGPGLGKIVPRNRIMDQIVGEDLVMGPLWEWVHVRNRGVICIEPLLSEEGATRWEESQQDASLGRCEGLMPWRCLILEA